MERVVDDGGGGWAQSPVGYGPDARAEAAGVAETAEDEGAVRIVPGHDNGDQLERLRGGAGDQEVEVSVADTGRRIALDQSRVGSQADRKPARGNRDRGRWCELEQQRQQQHGVSSV